MGALFLLLAGIASSLNLDDYLRANATIAARMRQMDQIPQFLDFNEFLLSQNLSALSFLALFFLPLMAMGLLTEERKSGTLELLMTSPVGEGTLILGKWCAAQIHFLCLLVLALSNHVLLGLWGPLHWPTLLCAALGLSLMGGAFLALALWLGSLTKSTLVAASSGFALMLILWGADSFARPGASGFPGGFLTELSALGHLAPMLRGLLDMADLAYFLVLTLLGLDLARRSLQFLRSGMQRTLSPRLQSILRSAAILFLGGALVFLALRHPLRWDLSPSRLNSLSPQTLSILDGLAGPVSVTLFFPDREPERSRTSALLGAFSAGRPSFSWENIDPGQNPRRALQEGATEPGAVILRHGERRESFVVPADVQGVYGLDETRLAQALGRLLQSKKALIRVVQGPGLRRLEDPAGFSALKQVLETQDYQVEGWNYLGDSQGRIPAGTDLLLLPGPHRSLPAPFLAGLEAYLEAGGALLLFLDPAAEMADSSLAAGLEGLLARRGLALGRGFIVDLSEENIQLGKGFEVPVVGRYGEHPVTRPFLRLSELCAFPLARSLRDIEGVTPSPQPLALTADKCFEENGPFEGRAHFDAQEDAQGPFVLAAASDSSSTGGGPLVVIGDSHFATGEHIDWQGNANLILNSAAWLAGETRRLEAGSGARSAALLELNRKERSRYLLYNLVILPLITLALWPLRLLARRRRGAGGAS